jgi:hypothetical protein
MSVPNKTTGITAEERRIRSERLKSRLMGICEGFDAGASIDAREQEAEITRLEARVTMLEAQNERLREALEKIVTNQGYHAPSVAKQALAAQEPKL